MKLIIINLLLIILSFDISAQTPVASSCNTGNCYKVSVKIEKRGDQNRLYFVIKNKMSGPKDLALFLEDETGKWHSAGRTTNPIPSNESYTFDKFNVSGNYVVYYKDAGDNSLRFPTQEEVREKFTKKNYGYGN